MFAFTRSRTKLEKGVLSLAALASLRTYNHPQHWGEDCAETQDVETMTEASLAMGGTHPSMRAHGMG
ncbi:MAG: hypothetical protein EA401_13980 [Planctomycetota bacterium]|nr:MAG: hypothetical protein EA401_13980 [Planctomycetota bacterium]